MSPGLEKNTKLGLVSDTIILVTFVSSITDILWIMLQKLQADIVLTMKA